MDLPGIPLFTVLKERMSWLDARQELLAQNVANSDVAGFVPQDLKPLDFAELVKNAGALKTPLSVTDPNHIALPAQSTSPFEVVDKPEAEATQSGNGVGVEEEMMKVGETQAQYQAAANLYAKSVQLMRTAIDRQGS